MSEKKIYRPNVAAVILSSAYPEVKEVFVAERSDINGAWQFPQGGIDEGESAKEALFRELKEEIGTDDIEVIAEYPEWISYDFPSKVASKMKPYAGQKQRYFLVKLNKGATIDLDTKHPEFSLFKFIGVDGIADVVANFKKPVYMRVIDYFKQEGYL